MKAKMRFKNFVILIAIVQIALSVSAHAGREGHGGIAVVCRDSKDKITYAELLDVFEVEQDPELKWMARSPGKYEEDPWVSVYEIAYPLIYSNSEHTQFRKSVGADDSKLYMLGVDLLHFHKKVMERNRIAKLDSKVRRTLPKDFNPRFRKEGCPFEVAAFYDKTTGKTIFDQDILFSMPVTSRTALYTHEALFWAARENYGALTSDDIRPLVGLLNSNLPEQEKIKTLLDPAQKIVSVQAVLGESEFQNASKHFLLRRIKNGADRSYLSQLAIEQLINVKITDDQDTGSIPEYRVSIHNESGDIFFNGALRHWNFSTYFNDGKGYMVIYFNAWKYSASLSLSSVSTSPVFKLEKGSDLVVFEMRSF